MEFTRDREYRCSLWHTLSAVSLAILVEVLSLNLLSVYIFMVRLRVAFVVAPWRARIKIMSLDRQRVPPHFRVGCLLTPPR